MLQVGQLVRVTNREDVDAAAALAHSACVIVMDAEGWQSIPAENLVAAFAVCALLASGRVSKLVTASVLTCMCRDLADDSI